MRLNAKWTSSGIILWIVAAAIATLVVCSEMGSPPADSDTPSEVEFEVETIE